MNIPEQAIWNILLRRMKFNPRDFSVTGAGARNLNVELRNAGARGSVQSCPFAATANGSTFKFVRPGSLNPVGMPTNMFDGSDIFSATITDDIIFLVGKVSTNGIVPTSWELELRTTPAEPTAATPNVLPSYFEFDMFAVLGRQTVMRIIDCGNLTALPVEYLVTDNPEPGCGVNPTVTHYSWEVALASS